MRDLTKREADVLGHVVVDPAAWWAHVSKTHSEVAEHMLAAKMSRYAEEFAAYSVRPDYKNRAQREAAIPAEVPDTTPRVQEELAAIRKAILANDKTDLEAIDRRHA